MAVSYSTLQRKVRTINQQLGTKYSAKEILQREIAAERRGLSTTEYQGILRFKGTRADVKTPPPADESTAYFLQQQFAELAERDPQVRGLTHGHAGDVISKSGHVWRYDSRAGVWRNLTDDSRSKTAPVGSIPWTPKDALRALELKQKTAARISKHSPQTYYEPIDLSSLGF